MGRRLWDVSFLTVSVEREAPFVFWAALHVLSGVAVGALVTIPLWLFLPADMALWLAGATILLYAGAYELLKDRKDRVTLDQIGDLVERGYASVPWCGAASVMAGGSVWPWVVATLGIGAVWVVFRNLKRNQDERLGRPFG